MALKTNYGTIQKDWRLNCASNPITKPFWNGGSLNFAFEAICLVQLRTIWICPSFCSEKYIWQQSVIICFARTAIFHFNQKTFLTKYEKERKKKWNYRNPSKWPPLKLSYTVALTKRCYHTKVLYTKNTKYATQRWYSTNVSYT